MERTRTFVTIVLCLCLNISIGSNKKEIYRAYITNDMHKWKLIINTMNAAPSKSNEFILELLNYQYGYIAWCLGNKRKKEAKEYLKIADKNIKILINNRHKIWMTHAYKAAFYGYKISLRKYMAPIWGRKSLYHAEKSLSENPDSWFVYIQLANIFYYRPSFAGGSKNKALNYYLKAKELIEIDDELCHKNWNYLNLLISIAQTYESLNDYDNAKIYYEIILSMEPHFKWVKQELYINLIEKINENKK